MIYKCLFAGDRLNRAEGRETRLMKDKLELCINYHKYDPFVFINHISLAIIFKLHFFVLYYLQMKYGIKEQELVSVTLIRPVPCHTNLQGRVLYIYIYIYIYI
jgi:hypothetical protein